MRQIEAAQQVAVGLDAVGIIEVAAGEEAQDVGGPGLDDALEPVGRKGAAADEIDPFDRRLLAFRDLEHEIDAVGRARDGLWLDPHVEAAAVLVEIDDPDHVGLHGRRDERAARLGLQLGGQLLVLEAFVALESDAIDERGFDHRDGQAVGGARDLHVREQAAGVKRLETRVDRGGVERLARLRFEITADGVGLEAPVALDRDRRDGALRRREPRPERQERDAEHDAGRETPARRAIRCTQTHRYTFPTRHGQPEGTAPAGPKHDDLRQNAGRCSGGAPAQSWRSAGIRRARASRT